MAEGTNGNGEIPRSEAPASLSDVARLRTDLDRTLHIALRAATGNMVGDPDPTGRFTPVATETDAAAGTASTEDFEVVYDDPTAPATRTDIPGAIRKEPLLNSERPGLLRRALVGGGIIVALTVVAVAVGEALKTDDGSAPRAVATRPHVAPGSAALKGLLADQVGSAHHLSARPKVSAKQLGQHRTKHPEAHAAKADKPTAPAVQQPDVAPVVAAPVAPVAVKAPASSHDTAPAPKKADPKQTGGHQAPAGHDKQTANKKQESGGAEYDKQADSTDTSNDAATGGTSYGTTTDASSTAATGGMVGS